VVLHRLIYVVFAAVYYRCTYQIFSVVMSLLIHMVRKGQSTLSHLIHERMRKLPLMTSICSICNGEKIDNESLI
jgi:hypothetical protein